MDRGNLLIQTPPTTETATLIADANQFRSPQEGIGIDDSATIRPEGLVAATQHKDKSYFDFAASVIDPSILPGSTESIYRLVDKLRTASPDEIASIQLQVPPERQQLAFSTDRTVPALTLTGVYKAVRAGGQGFADFQLKKTRVRPELYAYDDPDLPQNSIYLSAASLAHAIRRHELGTKQGSPDKLHPAQVSEIFAHLMSIGIAEICMHIPELLLLHASRGRAVIANGPTLEPLVITTEATSLLPYRQHNTVDLLGSTIRPRKTKQWLNLVLTSNFMENGASLLDHSDLELVANWLNARQRSKLERRYGGRLIELCLKTGEST